MGAIESVALTVIPMQLGALLISTELWLTDPGLHRLRIICVPKPKEGPSQEGLQMAQSRSGWYAASRRHLPQSFQPRGAAP